jgi:kynurenine formamidase
MVNNMPASPDQPENKLTKLPELKNAPVKFIDVSHTVEKDMVTYKGIPGPLISDYRSREASRDYYADGTEFHIGKIEMIATTGTYIDSPFHRFPDGKDLSELPLDGLANLPGVCISAEQLRAIGPASFYGKNVAGKAVLVRTGWSRHWLRETYFDDPPFLTQEAAELLVKNKAALVGIDSMNIDDIHDKTRPVHTLLLRVNIPIIEHLTSLSELPEEGFRLFAVPVKIKSFGSFPVRAFAMVP